MSIPLVQNNEKDSINTSIIAIKRNIERINMLLGLVDSGSPDLSGLATKQELQDAVNSLQPVDEVTSGNMHSVTSNAVAKYTSSETIEVTYSGTNPTHYFNKARWRVFNINGLCLLIGYNTTSKSVTPTWYNLPKPAGYTTLQILFADAYISGNAGNINGALASDILYITGSGTIDSGGFRMMYLATKD